MEPQLKIVDGGGKWWKEEVTAQILGRHCLTVLDKEHPGDMISPVSKIWLKSGERYICEVNIVGQSQGGWNKRLPKAAEKSRRMRMLMWVCSKEDVICNLDESSLSAVCQVPRVQKVCGVGKQLLFPGFYSWTEGLTLVIRVQVRFLTMEQTAAIWELRVPV